MYNKLRHTNPFQYKNLKEYEIHQSIHLNFTTEQLYFRKLRRK